MSEEQVKSLVGTLTRRNEGDTKVLRVDDLAVSDKNVALGYDLFFTS